MAMELDRLHAVKADLAEENLARGFTGKLQDAHCSVEEDAQQILEQLRESGHEKEVEVPCNECMLDYQKVCSSPPNSCSVSFLMKVVRVVGKTWVWVQYCSQLHSAYSSPSDVTPRTQLKS